jgi:hypothetical protein
MSERYSPASWSASSSTSRTRHRWPVWWGRISSPLEPEAFKVRLDEDGRQTDEGAIRRVAEGNALVRKQDIYKAGRA